MTYRIRTFLGAKRLLRLRGYQFLVAFLRALGMRS